MNNKKIVLFVFFIAFVVRAYNLNIPFIEPYNNISRQSMCASVARNFYERGFNLFYPEVDEGGAGPYLYNVELPIYSYLMAIGYKITGGVREGVARSVSVFFSMLLLYFIYRFTRRLAGERPALFALIFASFSPMSVALSRSIQPDITMVAATTGALYTFYLYQETKKTRYFIASACWMLLSVLTKAFALYIFLPIFYVAWIYQGKKLFTDAKNYLYAAVICLGLSWYVYMGWVGRAQTLPYNPYIFARGEMAVHHSYWKLFLPRTLKYPAKILLIHILTPLGFLLFLTGIFSKKLTKENRIMLVWLLSVVLYLLGSWPTAVYHSYYLLPLVPVLAYWVGVGAEKWFDLKGVFSFLKSQWIIAGAVLLSGVLVFHFYKLLYFIPENRMAIVRTGQMADKIIPREDLIAACWGGSPIQLYYSHRKGWVLNLENKNTAGLIQKFEAHRADGAKWFVTSRTSDIKPNAEFEAYLLAHYKAVLDNKESLVIDLSTPA